MILQRRTGRTEVAESPHGHEGESKSRTRWNEQCWMLLRSQMGRGLEMSAGLNNMEPLVTLVWGVWGSRAMEPAWSQLVRGCGHWIWLVFKKSEREGEGRDEDEGWRKGPSWEGGREGIQAHMKEMVLGGKSSINKREQDRSCIQGAESGWGETVVPSHWLQLSLGSRSRGHVLGVGGRLGGSEA